MRAALSGGTVLKVRSHSMRASRPWQRREYMQGAGSEALPEPSTRCRRLTP